MSTPADCCTSCTEVPPVNIPGAEGATGAAGAAGTNGVNAYTLTTDDITLPSAIGGSKTIPVANNSWIPIGLMILVSDGTYKGTFVVTAKTGTTSITATWLGFAGDSAAGATIGSGAMASAGSSQQTLLSPESSYKVSGSQALTSSPADLLAATVTLTAGYWLLLASVRLDFDAATFNTSQAVLLQMVANDSSGVPNATRTIETGSTVLADNTLFAGEIPAVVFNAADGDVITIQGSVAATPYSGALNAVEASILAVKLF